MIFNLPSELFTAILRDLSPQDILKLGKSCSTAYNIIQPHIYSHIILDWPLDDVPPLELLVRTLLERPEYRSQVKQFSITGTFLHSANFWVSTIPRFPMTAFPMKDAISYIHATSLPNSYMEQWIEQLLQGTIDAMVSLVVALLPEVERLWLGSPITIENTILGNLIQHSLYQASAIGFTGLSPGLNLTSVTIQPRCDHEDRDDIPKNTTAMLPFFSLPRLSALSISIDNPDTIQWPTKVPPIAKGLTSFELYRIREDNLLPILSTMPNLERFEWHWFYISSLDPNITTPVIDLNLISQALSQVRNTLSTLIIYAGTCPGANDIDFDYMSTEGVLDLSVFYTLKMLSIPWVFFMGFSPSDKRKSLFQYLPKTLEVLVLSCNLHGALSWRWDVQDDSSLEELEIDEESDSEGNIAETEFQHYNVAAAMITMLQNFTKSTLPDLRKIEMCWGGGDPNATQEQQNVLGQITRTLGIELRWVKNERIGPFYMPEGSV